MKQAVQMRCPREMVAARQEQGGLLPADGHDRDERHAGLQGQAALRVLEGTGVGVTTVLPNLANTRLGSGLHAARGRNKLDAAEIADAIVDGLRRRRAEVYVPASLRPLNVLDRAMRAVLRVVHHAFGSDAIAQDFDCAGRAAYQEAAGRPLGASSLHP